MSPLEKRVSVYLHNFIPPSPSYIGNTIRATADPEVDTDESYRFVRESRKGLIKQLTNAAESEYYTEQNVLVVRTAAAILSLDPQSDFIQSTKELQNLSAADILTAQHALAANFKYGGVSKENIGALAIDYPDFADVFSLLIQREAGNLDNINQQRTEELRSETVSMIFDQYKNNRAKFTDFLKAIGGRNFVKTLLVSTTKSEETLVKEAISKRSDTNEKIKQLLSQLSKDTDYQELVQNVVEECKKEGAEVSLV